MRTSDFDYNLPQELIAQTPIEPRDASRLLVLDRATGHCEHKNFHQIIEHLRPGDVMVFNQSRVIPARLRGRRTDTGGKVEFLLLRRESPGVWQALARPGRRLKAGATVILEAPERSLVPLDEGDKSPPTPLFKGGTEGQSSGSEMRETAPRPPLVKGGIQGGLQVEVLASNKDGIKLLQLASEDAINQVGRVPLPPYIHARLEDPERYQTVYARQLGSAAAPTAGLHFTEELLDSLERHGVELAFVTLHVGLDTFRPVQGEDPRQHRIHTEYYDLSRETAGVLNRARSEGRRIVAVGTTSVRVLEQAARDMEQQGREQLMECRGPADLFILPGHRFRMVDAIVTNFHLPRSTLLMLVSAFAGRELVLHTYQEAIRERYRFYSFGDAMFIC
jgi:S-adenosylmethionine:tRNA ribosyltransferase-isomerase